MAVGRLTGGLLLTCALLSGVVYLELDGVFSSDAAAPGGAPARAAGSVDAWAPPELFFQFPPQSAFAAIAARPLFHPSRRPPAKEPAAPAAARVWPKTGGFRLRGVAVGDGRGVILLERRETGELVRVVQNRAVDGWNVVMIEPRAVVLEQGGVRDRLELEHDVGPPVQAVHNAQGGGAGPDDGWTEIAVEDLDETTLRELGLAGKE
jgi:hypothetical protein